MAWVAIGSAVIGAGASLYGASQEADAQSEASETSFLMAMEAMTFVDEGTEQIAELQEPWITAGINALEAIVNTPDFEFTPETFDFMADPSYEWRVNEGIDALDQSASSTGTLLSGAQSMAITEYGQDMASQEYQSAWERWMAEQQFDYNTQVGEYGINMGTDMAIMGAGQDATNVLSQTYANDASSKANLLLGGTAGYNTGAINSAEAVSDGASGVATAVNTGISNYLVQPSAPTAPTTPTTPPSYDNVLDLF